MLYSERMSRVFLVSRIVSCPESGRLFRDLVGEFEGGKIEVLHKIDEIHKLIVAHRGCANTIIDVSVVDLRHRFLILWQE